MSVISERERLAELAGYNVLDTSAEPAFDTIVRAAAEGTGCPTALISLLDEDRQWFKARCGLDVGETPRDQAFCEHALRADAPVIVADATMDHRFQDNPLVTGAPGIRFYAGFPLRTPTGAVLGTLCVLGYEPRPAGLTGVQSRLLELLAEQVMAQLNLRRALAEQVETSSQLETALSAFRALADDATDVVSRHALDGTTLYVSPSIRDILGYDPEREVGHAAPERVHPEDTIEMMRALGLVLAGEASTASVRSRHADDSWRHLEIRLSPMRDDHGVVVQIHSVARDVTERHIASERLAVLAAEVRTAHDEAVQRGALTDAVLHTVDVGIVACDGDGRLTTFNRATREFHGMPPDPDLDPAEWADRYALFAEDGHSPLRRDEVPLFRALTEGVVSDAVVVIAPEGLPARTVQCEGRALHDPAGKVLGAVVVMSDFTRSRATARALAEQAEYTRVLLEAAHSAIWSFDHTGRPTFVNSSARQILGGLDTDSLQRVFDEGGLPGLTDTVKMLRPDGSPMDVAERPLARALAGKHSGEVEVLLVASDRPGRVVLMEASPLHDNDGVVTGALITGHDVTALRASEARFRAAFHDGPTPVARLDADGLVVEINPALQRLTSVHEHSLRGRLLADHVAVDDRARLLRALTGSGTGSEPVEVRLQRADGTQVWCEVATTLSADPDGETSILAQFLDIDARKRQEVALERAARRDPLTGLANRSELGPLALEWRDGPADSTIGMLFLDLDGFKAVNDAHGHDAGDAVLVEVARRLTATVRPGDIVVRLGGDEFLVACRLPPQQPEQTLAALADRLECEIARPLAVGAQRLVVGVTVGQAVGVASQPMEELVEAADSAMYRRKRVRAEVATSADLPESSSL